MNIFEMDKGFLILCAMGLVCVISITLAIIAIVNYRKMYRKFDFFMRGRDAANLEGLIMEEKRNIEDLQDADEYNKENMRSMNRNIRASFQKVGIVRYDAFDGMGGKMSFSMALLDYTNTGIVLNCMHAREGCFLYVKEVDGGTTDTPLGIEERAALEKALGYVKV